MDGEGYTGVCWTPAALGFSLCRSILSHPVCVVLGTEPRTSHMLGRSLGGVRGASHRTWKATLHSLPKSYSLQRCLLGIRLPVSALRPVPTCQESGPTSYLLPCSPVGRQLCSGENCAIAGTTLTILTVSPWQRDQSFKKAAH